MEYRVAKSYEHFHYDITKAYKNSKGKMVVDVKEPCSRCNGSGIAISHVCNGQPIPYVNDGGICYGCNGTGYFHKTIRLYTDKEYETMEKAKISAANKRETEREEKMRSEYAGKRSEWLEKHCFNEDLKTYVYAMADSYEVKEQLKSAGFRFSKDLLWHIAVVPEEYAEKVVEIKLDKVAEIGAWGEGFFRPEAKSYVEEMAKQIRPAEPESEWIGEEKERLSDILVTLKSIRGMETRYGYTQLVKFIDMAGNELNWWTAVDIQFEIGDEILLTGTVKKHDSYNERKITVLTRCKLKAAE